VQRTQSFAGVRGVPEKPPFIPIAAAGGQSNNLEEDHLPPKNKMSMREKQNLKDPMELSCRFIQDRPVITICTKNRRN
jgi:hypothetical protein